MRKRVVCDVTSFLLDTTYARLLRPLKNTITRDSGSSHRVITCRLETMISRNCKRKNTQLGSTITNIYKHTSNEQSLFTYAPAFLYTSHLSDPWHNSCPLRRLLKPPPLQSPLTEIALHTTIGLIPQGAEHPRLLRGECRRVRIVNLTMAPDSRISKAVEITSHCGSILDLSNSEAALTSG